jgi:hypothetical protein
MLPLTVGWIAWLRQSKRVARWRGRGVQRTDTRSDTAWALFSDPLAAALWSANIPGRAPTIDMVNSPIRVQTRGGIGSLSVARTLLPTISATRRLEPSAASHARLEAALDDDLRAATHRDRP